MAAHRSTRKSGPSAGAAALSRQQAAEGHTVFVTRRVQFSAAHRYLNRRWSARKNQRVFGACFNPHGHGHNYTLEVTLSGALDPETAMVMNLRDVDAILRREVLRRFDHRHINEEVEGFQDLNPTVEALCLRLWDLLEPCFRRRGCRLHRVRLFESDGLWAEYLGEGAEAPR